MPAKETEKKGVMIKGFIMHLVAYILVNAFLIWINLSQDGYLWFYWPLFGWGIGLIIHGVALALSGKK